MELAPQAPLAEDHDVDLRYTRKSPDKEDQGKPRGYFALVGASFQVLGL